MTTLLQIFAVVMIGLTVGAWIAAGLGVPAPSTADRLPWWRRFEGWLKPNARGLGIAVAVVATFFFWTQLWNYWVARTGERRAFATLPSDVARHQDASIGKINQPFLDFVRRKLKPGDTYAIAPSSILNGGYQHQWISYVLTPNLLVDPEDADWLIVFKADPEQVDYDDESFPALEMFEDKYAIGRRADAR